MFDSHQNTGDQKRDINGLAGSIIKQALLCETPVKTTTMLKGDNIITESKEHNQLSPQAMSVNNMED